MTRPRSSTWVLRTVQACGATRGTTGADAKFLYVACIARAGASGRLLRSEGLSLRLTPKTFHPPPRDKLSLAKFGGGSMFLNI